MVCSALASCCKAITSSCSSKPKPVQSEYIGNVPVVSIPRDPEDSLRGDPRASPPLEWRWAHTQQQAASSLVSMRSDVDSQRNTIAPGPQGQTMGHVSLSNASSLQSLESSPIANERSILGPDPVLRGKYDDLPPAAPDQNLNSVSSLQNLDASPQAMERSILRSEVLRSKHSKSSPTTLARNLATAREGLAAQSQSTLSYAIVTVQPSDNGDHPASALWTKWFPGSVNDSPQSPTRQLDTGVNSSRPRTAVGSRTISNDSALASVETVPQ